MQDNNFLDKQEERWKNQKFISVFSFKVYIISSKETLCYFCFCPQVYKTISIRIILCSFHISNTMLFIFQVHTDLPAGKSNHHLIDDAFM